MRKIVVGLLFLLAWGCLAGGVAADMIWPPKKSRGGSSSAYSGSLSSYSIPTSTSILDRQTDYFIDQQRRDEERRTRETTSVLDEIRRMRQESMVRLNRQTNYIWKQTVDEEERMSRSTNTFLDDGSRLIAENMINLRKTISEINKPKPLIHEPLYEPISRTENLIRSQEPLISSQSPDYSGITREPFLSFTGRVQMEAAINPHRALAIFGPLSEVRFELAKRGGRL